MDVTEQAIRSALTDASADVVRDASELVKGEGAEVIGNGLFASLVPVDVLDELHARGEIDLYDPAGQPIHRAEDLEMELVDVDDEAVEEFFESEAVERMVDEPELAEMLASIRLFRDLDADGLAQLSNGARLHLVDDRGYVFREGEVAQSFFLVSDGAVEVLRRTSAGREIAMHQFQTGQAFGIFGLLAGGRRAASVRSIGAAEIIEISVDALAAVMQGYPKVRTAVMKLFEERLIETFLGSSPLFQDLPAIARGLLISQFKEKKLKAGDKLVSPGEVFNGLFLVVSGDISVTKRQGGNEDELAGLSRGHFFGIVSALSGTPCRVSVVALRETTVSILPQRAFNDFIKDYPILRQLPMRLAEQGMLVERDVFIGQTGIPGMS